MIYISIPIHEKLDVVKNQADNFKQFFPEARIVYHVSKQATFTIGEANDFMLKNKVDNVLINPKQVDTGWGSIIQAHIQNILFILEQKDATKICFHSSNDMIVRSGLYNYLRDKDYVFHNRYVRKPSYWWVGNVAYDDYRLLDWLAIHGGGRIVASQIEGSMYHIAFLKEFVDELLNCQPVLQSGLFYPREEILFSSFAVAKNLKSQGLPYILSEVHRFDKKLWSYFDHYRFVFNDNSRITRMMKKRLNDKLFDSTFYKISKKDIEAIRGQDTKFLAESFEMSDGGNHWQVYELNALFGVKRIERNMNDPLRQYILGLKS
ncbi:hypothetical protein [Faucicola boevrei]|uniref:hypothetical protein n=1 Tax=Faucicola boevrei TaxID=346665 RepID=UPI00037E02C8|nr:hypothetical protein [Moraxella boevrei]